MKLSTMIAMVVAFGSLCSPVVRAQDAQITRGMQIFADQKCAICHAVAGKGNTKGPLDDVGRKLSADEMRQWITNAKEMTAKTKATRKPEMKQFTLPKDDVDALVAYLRTLKGGK